MKAAVCRFKVEFTSLIRKIKWVAVLKYKLEVFTLHCILSCYTPEATRRGLRLIYVARLFSFEIGTVPFLWVITSTAFYTAVLLLSIFSCPCWQTALLSLRTHFPCDGAMGWFLGSIMNICLKTKTCSVSFCGPLPAPGWINRSCTFSFDGAPRVAHLTVVGLGSAGFQCYFDL